MGSLFLSTLLIGGPALAFCIQTFMKAKDNSKWYPVAAIGLLLTFLVSFYLDATLTTTPSTNHIRFSYEDVV